MFKKLNYLILIPQIFIFFLGALTLYSTYQSGIKAHVVSFTVGILVYLFLIFFDYAYIKSLWKIFYVVILCLLLFIYFISSPRFGAARWLDLGFFSFQPSEFAKILLLLYIPQLLIEEKIHKTINLIKVFLLSLPILVLTLLQPDLGTTLVMLSSMVFMLFVSKFPKIYFLIIFSVFGLLSFPIWENLHDYQRERILVLANPDLDKLGSGYNVEQSKIAVGSGGVFGKGLGHGTQSNLRFLPAYWTDFIFATFAEEWGLIGVTTLLLLYFLLILGIISNLKNPKEEHRILAGGVFGIFFFQILVNVGMNMGIMPVTGVTLPFMSYGGTSLLVSFAILGLLQGANLKS